MGSKLAKALLKPINTSAVVILGVLTLVWGLWVSNPFWEVFSAATVYGTMNDLLHEFWWGIGAMLVGGVMIHGVLVSSYKSLLTGAIAGYIFWTVVAIMYFFGNWQSTEGLVTIFIAIYCAFIALNIKVNRQSMQ